MSSRDFLHRAFHPFPTHKAHQPAASVSHGVTVVTSMVLFSLFFFLLFMILSLDRITEHKRKFKSEAKKSCELWGYDTG